MLILILRQNLQRFAKTFISDCLITPMCEVPEMGDFDVGIFLMLVLVILEGTKDKLELILVVVTPLRTKDVEAKGTIRTID